MEADLDKDGKISFEEFTKMVENTDVSVSMTLGMVFYVSTPGAFPFYSFPSPVCSPSLSAFAVLFVNLLHLC
jgi:hypothetical protein